MGFPKKSRGEKDDAAAEITAFILITAIIVTAVACFVLFYPPISAQNTQIEHDKEVLQKFSQIKTGVDILWLSDAKNSKLEYIIPLAPEQKTDIFATLFSDSRQSTGTIKIKKGTTYVINSSASATHNISPLTISYTSPGGNTIIYNGGSLFYGKSNNQNEYHKAADATLGDDSIYIINASSCKDTTISSNRPVKIGIKYLGFSGPYKPENNDFSPYAPNKKINNVFVLDFEIYATNEDENR